MGLRIKIDFQDFSSFAELLDTPTAEAVRDQIPFSSQVNRWGEEIYFCTPIDQELEGRALEVVEKGDVGYWPPGKAIAIFFGPTPSSIGQECRAVSPVNIFARICGDLSLLLSVPAGSRVMVSLEKEDNA